MPINTPKTAVPERRKIAVERASLYGETLGELIALYGPDASIETVTGSYGDSDYAAVFTKRDETDYEMAARLANEATYAKIREDRERAEFEKLRAKFGNK